MNRQNINLLDCTLRDGGYYNNWKFNKNLVNDYLKVISDYVSYIEIGFRFLDKDSSLGETAYTKSNFLKSIKIPKNVKLGVMINASDLIFYGNKNISKFIKKIFPKKDPKIKFVRMLYRPFQSDKDWEWPFNRKSVRDLEKYFTIESGFGWGRFSMPLSLIHSVPGIGSIMSPLYKRLLKRELSSKLSPDIWLNSTVVLCCFSKKARNN